MALDVCGNGVCAGAANEDRENARPEVEEADKVKKSNANKIQLKSNTF